MAKRLQGWHVFVSVMLQCTATMKALCTPRGAQRQTGREGGRANANRPSPVTRYYLTVCALTLRTDAKLLPMLAPSASLSLSHHKGQGFQMAYRSLTSAFWGYS